MIKKASIEITVDKVTPRMVKAVERKRLMKDYCSGKATKQQLSKHGIRFASL